jgi:hypothetical protein
VALPIFCKCILVAIGIVLVAIVIWIVLNYYMMRNSDYILTENWSEGYRLSNIGWASCLSIAADFVINRIRLPHSLCIMGG